MQSPTLWPALCLNGGLHVLAVDACAPWENSNAGMHKPQFPEEENNSKSNTDSEILLHNLQ